MVHKKRKDYEVAEIERDVWECDFCDREINDEDEIHVFSIDPSMGYDSSRADGRLIRLNKQEGFDAVEQATEIVSMTEGHICDECIREADLDTGGAVRGTYNKIMHTLGLE